MFIRLYLKFFFFNFYKNEFNRKDLNIPVLEVKYDYYFLIDYTIIEGICQPIELFNTTETINSIENMVEIYFYFLYDIFFVLD